jgi:membrane-associated protein
VEALLNFITNFGWLAVMIVIFAESGLMVGFFLPGDSLLFVSGTLVQRDIFHVNIALFIVCLWLAAAAGNSTGYYLGRKFGRKLFRKPDSRFFRQEYLQQAEAFYEKNGSKTIVIAMFVPIVRAFAPVVAGIAHMPYRKFALFNVIGALVWVSSFVLIGYLAGSVIERYHINIELAALVIIFLSLLPGIIHLLKEPENRAKIKHHARRITTRKR